MKVKSIKKRIKDKGFAPKIERETIYYGVEKLGIDLGEHIEHMIKALSTLELEQ